MFRGLDTKVRITPAMLAQVLSVRFGELSRVFPAVSAVESLRLFLVFVFGFLEFVPPARNEYFPAIELAGRYGVRVAGVEVLQFPAVR